MDDTITFFEAGLFVDGLLTLFDDLALINNAVISGGLDENGLGQIVFSISGAGEHTVGFYIDYEIDEGNNTFFNEFGLVSGESLRPDGLQFEIDEPGFVFGDIFDNFSNGFLDNINSVPQASPDDVALGLLFNFVLAPMQVATVTFSITSLVSNAFGLIHGDVDSPTQIFFTAELGISGGGACPVDLEGTNASEMLLGTDCNDTIDGGSGNDTIIGFDGDDFLQSKFGNNFIDGGEGNDSIFGAFGNDLLFGGDGDDFLDGRSGSDLIDGGDGNDVIVISRPRSFNENTLIGGAGDDSITSGDSGTTTIFAGEGRDFLFLGEGEDRIVFDALPNSQNYDQIRRFDFREDQLILDASVFTVLETGELSADNFVRGYRALDSDDYILLGGRTLFYDPDGSGPEARQVIAVFDAFSFVDFIDHTVFDVL